MQKYNQLGVEIDSCPKCDGVWLDSDEWAAMTRGRGKDAVKLEVLAGPNSGLYCPRCGMSRGLEIGTHSKFSDFKIDHCPKCKGCFFDRGELARLLAR